MKYYVLLLLFAAAAIPPTEALSRNQIVYYMVFADKMEIQNDIVAAKEQRASTQRDLLLGVLYMSMSVRNGKSEFARASYRHFKKVPDAALDTAVLYSMRGTASAFMARKAGIFGMNHLKKTQYYFDLIPDNHPDWFVRFLRGQTAWNIGKALPGFPPVGSIKKDLLEQGRNDLDFVIDKYENTDRRSEPAEKNANYTYVPREVYSQVIETLK